MGFELSNIFVFVLVGLAVPALMLTAGRLVRPRTPTKAKATIYECGEEPVGDARFRFNPRFYIVALAFLVFDVEAVLSFPVAVVFRRWVGRGAGSVAFFELLVFVGILGLALAYAWRRGDLDWGREEQR